MVASAASGSRTNSSRSFQSPSLRGSGRFGREGSRGEEKGGDFNPLHCGAVVASQMGTPVGLDWSISIPFIAGQWSLPVAAWRREAEARAFQSPSLRGSGRFRNAPLPRRGEGGVFQSPSLRGSGRFSLAAHQPLRPIVFQSPSLRGSGRFADAAAAAAAARPDFNPLHCGAVVASGAVVGGVRPPAHISIPFIAGQWSLLPRTTPSSLFGVLLRKRRLPCDHIICTRLPF